MLFSTRFCAVASLLIAVVLVPALSQAQQHFTNCLPNDVNDANVLVSSDVAVQIEGVDSLRTGDEIALFSNDGRCAGVGVWDETSDAISIAVAGVDTTAAIREGYENEERLKYRIWRQSDDQEFDVSSASYTCTLPGCRADGLFERDAFYEVTQLTASAPLPVELTTFEATRSGSSVVLTWRTASETNNTGFKIQHKSSSTDSWTTLSFVDGAGTTSTPQDYRFESKDLKYGEHRFRLAQIDQDGSRGTTKTLNVRLRLDSAYELSDVYPNPVQHAGSVDLTVKQAQHVSVRVYDLLGRSQRVLFDQKIAPDRTKTLRLNADHLPSGSYFLRVEGEHFQATRRLTVVK